jgi:hypothetical protein
MKSAMTACVVAAIVGSACGAELPDERDGPAELAREDRNPISRSSQSMPIVLPIWQLAL